MPLGERRGGETVVVKLGGQARLEDLQAIAHLQQHLAQVERREALVLARPPQARQLSFELGPHGLVEGAHFADAAQLDHALQLSAVEIYHLGNDR